MHARAPHRLLHVRRGVRQAIADLQHRAAEPDDVIRDGAGGGAGGGRRRLRDGAAAGASWTVWCLAASLTDAGEGGEEEGRAESAGGRRQVAQDPRPSAGAVVAAVAADLHRAAAEGDAARVAAVLGCLPAVAKAG